MKVTVVLHSFLRDLLPPEDKGTTVLELPDGATVSDVVARLKLPAYAQFALNDQLQRDRALALKDGDTLRFLRAGAGG
jgi:molybdopterin converting factor small subunit